MQYAVPQFTDIEDKLIGPLTLRQFLSLLGTGAVVMFFYSLLKLSIFFFFFALPTALLGIGLTFGKYNGRPLFGYTGALLYFITRPQARVFKREEPTIAVSYKAPKVAEVKKGRLEEPDQSRLRKLAYLLDQKTEEEKQLLEKNDK